MSKYALVNCNLLDGCNWKVKPSMTILTEDGKIKKIGNTADIKDLSGYKTIDLNGKYVMPGLINAHIHLPLSGKGSKATSSGKSQDRLLKLLDTGMGHAVLMSMMKKNISAQLNSGVTTCRSMGDLFFQDIVLRDKVKKGEIQGPRLLVAGPIVTPTGGHGMALGVIADGPWEVRKVVRKNIHEQVDVIKIANTGGVTDARKVGEAGRPTMTYEEVAAACEEAHKAGLMVASHAEGTEGVRTALKAGVDTIEHGAVLDDEMIELFLNNPNSLRGYSSLIPTLYPAVTIANLDPSITYMNEINIKNSILVYEGMIQGIKKAIDKGVKVGMGTDASMSFVTHYNTWIELDYLVKFAGLSPEQALSNATRVNAEILGIDDETGTLEEGKSSDLIVLNENPLDNIKTLSKVSMVMAGDNFISKPKIKTISEVDKAIDSINFQEA
ncbi:MAG: amidohydrolase family protein [Spirochaetales bacterium]|nr:amidohydrolase family protein [Spirochaetales bacterium]